MPWLWAVDLAGLACARGRLPGSKPNVRVTLLDKNNYQGFPEPLFYQVATAILLSGQHGGLSARGIITHNHANVDVKMTGDLDRSPHAHGETWHGQR